MKRIFTLISIMILVLASCSLIPDGSVLDEIEETLPAITYMDQGAVYDTRKSALLVEPVSNPQRDGLVFSGWSYDEGGSAITSWNGLLNSDVTLYALWTYDENSDYLVVSSSGDDSTGDGSLASPYATIAKALEESSGENKIFIIGTIEENVTLNEGDSLLLSGINSSIANATISGRIVMAKDSSLSLENMTLTNDSSDSNTTGGMGLVFSQTGGFELSINNSSIIPQGAAYGIEISLSSGADASPVAIEVNDSVIDLSNSDVGASYARGGSYGRAGGIVVNNKYSTTGVEYEYLDSLSLTLHDSEIRGNVDPSISTINVLLNKIDQIDLDIANSEITAVKNHYPIFINDCGNEETRSSVNISDSFLKGWCAIYVRNGSANVDVDIRNARIECISDNSGDSNNFSVFPIHSSLNSTLTLSDSSVTYGKSEVASPMAIFVYQFNNTYGGGVKYIMRNTDFTYKGTYSLEDDYIAAIDHLPESDRDTTFDIDDATMNSILSIVDGSRLEEVHENYPVAADFIVDYTVYRLSVEEETSIN